MVQYQDQVSITTAMQTREINYPQLRSRFLSIFLISGPVLPKTKNDTGGATGTLVIVYVLFALDISIQEACLMHSSLNKYCKLGHIMCVSMHFKVTFLVCLNFSLAPEFGRRVKRFRILYLTLILYRPTCEQIGIPARLDKAGIFTCLLPDVSMLIRTITLYYYQ